MTQVVPTGLDQLKNYIIARREHVRQHPNILGPVCANILLFFDQFVSAQSLIGCRCHKNLHPCCISKNTHLSFNNML